MPTEKHIPGRQCVGCGLRTEKGNLLRVIRTPEGDVRVDPTGRGNGRGAYLCRKEECLQIALKKRGLQRTLKCEIPEIVIESIRAVFEQGSR